VNIVIGVCGGIAAYKVANLVSALKKKGHGVDVVMTKNACEFVAPLTFQTLSGNPVTCDTFQTPIAWNVAHVSLAKKADVILVAPATANIIGKVACGIADDMLSTTIMAARGKVVFAPAMNTAMYENPIVQENMAKLKGLGYHFVEADSGYLVCGDSGVGRLAEMETILEYLDAMIQENKDLTEKNILVTAGPTHEYMDPVRFISNPSSGKMGYAVARAAVRRGANVTLISGPVNLVPPVGVRVVPVTSASDMHDAVLREFKMADALVKAAAVADFRPVQASTQKLKKEQITSFEIEKNPDILHAVCQNKGDKVVVGFCMETQDVLENAQRKLLAKGADLIVANSVAQGDSAFASDNNNVLILGKNGEQITSGPQSKEQIADLILDQVVKLLP